MVSVRDGVAVLAVAAALAAVLLAGLAGPAGATMPPKKCGTIHVNHKGFKVRGHLIGCDRARKASRKYLAHGDHGSSWSCQRYPPKQTKIAFTCRKGRKDYYAIRK